MRALVIDNAIVEFPSDFHKFRERFSNVSMRTPVTDAEYESLGLFRVETASEPAYTAKTHAPRLRTVPDVEGGKPVLNYDLAPLTTIEKEEHSGNRWKNLRERRAMILSKTDHLMLRDSPLTDRQMVEAVGYRQALRNLPSVVPDIYLVKNVDLPVKPEFISLDDGVIFNLKGL